MQKAGLNQSWMDRDLPFFFLKEQDLPFCNMDGHQSSRACGIRRSTTACGCGWPCFRLHRHRCVLALFQVEEKGPRRRKHPVVMVVAPRRPCAHGPCPRAQGNRQEQRSYRPTVQPVRRSLPLALQQASVPAVSNTVEPWRKRNGCSILCSSKEAGLN